MNRLVSDTFLRHIAQALVLALFLVLALVPILLLLVMYLQAVGALVGFPLSFAQFLLSTISLPLADSTAQVSTVIITAIPVVVAAVCYQPNDATPPGPSDTRNIVGNIAVLALIIGALAALLALALFTANIGLINTINRNPAQSLLVRGVVGGILSFQVLYLTRFFGLETKS